MRFTKFTQLFLCLLLVCVIGNLAQAQYCVGGNYCPNTLNDMSGTGNTCFSGLMMGMQIHKMYQMKYWTLEDRQLSKLLYSAGEVIGHTFGTLVVEGARILTVKSGEKVKRYE